jgi:GH15 family glucan-1,4-alpha-glucosidase
MALPIEDYALLGDTQSAALVGRDGSIDWLCLPRFDSGACFAALLGTPDHGRWLMAPTHPGASVSRHYRGDTLVLETEFTTPEGKVRVTDCMPPRGQFPDVVRVVEGISGRVDMRMELVVRFDYGAVMPWARRLEGGMSFVGGPDALFLRTPAELHPEAMTTVSHFVVSAGERVPFVLTWHPSHMPPPREIDAGRAVQETVQWWEKWAERGTYEGPYGDAVVRSLLTLKALTYGPTGGIVAAPTTSLPEEIGGSRNWDYRFCWLRDATFTLYALMLGGYADEAIAWRNWLLRAAAGDPSKLQTLYGPGGERRLPELALDWLPGYEGSSPVRVGNEASLQFQLDVYGELMDALHLARRDDLDGSGEGEGAAWSLQAKVLDYLEGAWQSPDEGIWEVRGPRRHFTHSKVLAWVAFDRAVKDVTRFGLEGPVERWKALRQQVHDEVCDQAFDPVRQTFTQSYGSTELDAAVLLIPLVGFLPATDPRMLGTIAAIEGELLEDGFVRRYSRAAAGTVDGVEGSEGAFLPCSFWLADNLALAGRRDDATALFERLLDLRNDVGLISEEYDPSNRRLIGNFPQAFTHVSLVNTAHNLTGERGPATSRHSE